MKVFGLKMALGTELRTGIEAELSVGMRVEVLLRCHSKAMSVLGVLTVENFLEEADHDG